MPQKDINVLQMSVFIIFVFVAILGYVVISNHCSCLSTNLSRLNAKYNGSAHDEWRIIWPVERAELDLAISNYQTFVRIYHLKQVPGHICINNCIKT